MKADDSGDDYDEQVNDGDVKGLLCGTVQASSDRMSSDQRYLQLFQCTSNGVAFLEMIYDSSHNPLDFIIREANDAYAALLGIPHHELIDRKASTIPGYECFGSVRRFAQVVDANETKQFQTYSSLTKKHLNVSAFALDEGVLATVLVDITKWEDTRHELKRSLGEVNRSLKGAVNALSATTAWRDPYTSNHQHRVARLACAIGEKMALNKHDIEGLYIAGLLHDIGKIAVPIDILCKPGKITDNEFGIIKDHPKVGYDILHGVHFPWPVADIVLQHHARLDGSGYPAGLKDDDISMLARIVAVADVVEAISSHRPYRPALGLSCALDEITRHAGVRYDADVVTACCDVCENLNLTLFSPN